MSPDIPAGFWVILLRGENVKVPAKHKMAISAKGRWRNYTLTHGEDTREFMGAPL